VVYHLILIATIHGIEKDWSSFYSKELFPRKYSKLVNCISIGILIMLVVVNSLMLLCDCVLSVL